MNDVTDRVRETFETVGREVSVPVFDELAFRRNVAEARRRRGLRLTAGIAAAASVAAVAAYAVPPLLDRDVAGGSPQVAAGPQQLHPEALHEPLYFSAGMRLMAATPDGEVHDLGASESIVGSTAEGVLAVGVDSRPMWIGASSSHEGDGSFTFERGSGPVHLPDTGPVQSLALSGDGRWFAWLDLEDVVSVYDLKAEAVVASVEVKKSAYVASVSDRGALVSEGGRLTLYGDPDVEVPTKADGYGWLSDTSGDYVSVADRDDTTRLYDLTREGEDGVAKLVDSVPGTGRLAPYARGLVSLKGSTVTIWPMDGEPYVPSGIDGRPQSVGWFDEDNALVTTGDNDGTTIYLCPIAETSCTPVAFSETDVRLSE